MNLIYFQKVRKLFEINTIISFLTNGINAKKIISIISILVVLSIVVGPVFNLIKILFRKLFRRNKNNNSSSSSSSSSSNKKIYTNSLKISTSSDLTLLEDSSSSLNLDSSSKKQKGKKQKEKKQKVKLNKKKILKTLKKYDLKQ